MNPNLNDDETLPMNYPAKPPRHSIGTFTVQTKNTFKGKISVWENGVFLWSQISSIVRLNHEDAHYDARQMRKEVLELNGMTP